MFFLGGIASTMLAGYTYHLLKCAAPVLRAH